MLVALGLDTNRTHRSLKARGAVSIVPSADGGGSCDNRGEANLSPLWNRTPERVNDIETGSGVI